jgi:hypothetical protein
MASASFRAALKPSGRGGGHLVEVPPKVIEALGGKGRIPVTATFNGVPYRGSIVRMGEGSVLGVRKAIMAEAGVTVGRHASDRGQQRRRAARGRAAAGADDGVSAPSGETGVPGSHTRTGVSTRNTSPRRSGRRPAPAAPSARSSNCWRRSAEPQSEGSSAPGTSQPALCISDSASRYASSSDGGGPGSIPFT